MILSNLTTCKGCVHLHKIMGGHKDEIRNYACGMFWRDRKTNDKICQYFLEKEK